MIAGISREGRYRPKYIRRGVVQESTLMKGCLKEGMPEMVVDRAWWCVLCLQSGHRFQHAESVVFDAHDGILHSVEFLCLNGRWLNGHIGVQHDCILCPLRAHRRRRRLFGAQLIYQFSVRWALDPVNELYLQRRLLSSSSNIRVVSSFANTMQRILQLITFTENSARSMIATAIWVSGGALPRVRKKTSCP